MTEKPTLAEALDRVRIRPLHWKPGAEQRLVCPECGGGSTREKSLSLRLDEDGGAVWTCHRGKCGWSDNIPAGTVQGGRTTAVPKAPPAPPRPPEDHARPERSEALYDFFAKRGISRATVDELGVYLLRDTWFPQLADEAVKTTTAVVFPYREGGEVVNHKYRGYRMVEVTGEDGVTRRVRDKIHRQDTGARKSLYNGDALSGLGAEDYCVAAEGEFDVAALWEAGIKTGWSIPDGTPAKLLTEDDPKRSEDKRYAPVMERLEDLRRVGRVILATDNDEPGRNHAEELARRIGKDRVWRIPAWPEGCKDVNDVLLAHGADALRELIESAEPWVVDGVYEGVSAAALAHHRDASRPQPLTTGLRSLDGILRLPQHGGGCLLTGAPGQGKSRLAMALSVYAAENHRWNVVFCSPEMGRMDSAAYMASIKTGASFYREGGMNHGQIADAARFLRRHITFLDRERGGFPLDWILDTTAAIHRRRRVNMLVLDGMKDVDFVASNNPDPKEAREAERRRANTMRPYLLNERLGEIRDFWKATGIFVLMVHHPHQLRRNKDGTFPLPTGYDLEGGAVWYNNVEAGITAEKAGDGEMRLVAWKARHEMWSAYGEARLRFQRETGRFFDVEGPSAVPAAAPPPASAEPADEDVPWETAAS